MRHSCSFMKLDRTIWSGGRNSVRCTCSMRGGAQQRGELVVAGALADPVDGAVLMFAGHDKSIAEDFARAAHMSSMDSSPAGTFVNGPPWSASLQPIRFVPPTSDRAASSRREARFAMTGADRTGSC